MVKKYWIEKDEMGYFVTDGSWTSAHYISMYYARKCMMAACWGERGADDLGTITGRV